MNNNETKPRAEFLRALIKVAHPDWSEHQVDEEVKKKLTQLGQDSDGEECEYCSS